MFKSEAGGCSFSCYLTTVASVEITQWVFYTTRHSQTHPLCTPASRGAESGCSQHTSAEVWRGEGLRAELAHTGEWSVTPRCGRAVNKNHQVTLGTVRQHRKKTKKHQKHQSEVRRTRFWSLVYNHLSEKIWCNHLPALGWSFLIFKLRGGARHFSSSCKR